MLAPQGAAQANERHIMSNETKAQGEAQGTFVGIEALVEATGANAKDVRRWIRAQARAVGAGDTLPNKGGRYAFTEAQVAALARAYAASKARKGTNATAQALMSALGE